jgi:hypothetical protein
MALMRGVAEPRSELSWLAHRPDVEAVTGYDAEGWESSTWLLHAMFENPSLPTEVTHHELRQSHIAQGLIEPLIIGEVNLDEKSTVTGTTLGFVVHPGSPWQRLWWSDYVDRTGLALSAAQPVPPGHRWFPSGSWPISINPPPEGSLDDVSLVALLRVLAEHSVQGGDSPCFAFYASLASGDFDHPTLLSGPLEAIRELVDGESPYRSTPSNFWPHDRAWFVWTDWDLWATKISGSLALVDAIRAEPDLETIDWPASRKPAS